MGNQCCNPPSRYDITMNLTHDNSQFLSLERIKKISDKTLAFKHMFPFNRMSIETLDWKLQHVSTNNVVSMDAFENMFCTTPAWKLLMPNVKMLLRRPMFKDIMNEVVSHSKFHYFYESELENFIPKLSISILGLLMCTGSQKIKANFLYDTLRYLSKDSPRIDEEMQYIFSKLMIISINLPVMWHQSVYE